MIEDKLTERLSSLENYLQKEEIEAFRLFPSNEEFPFSIDIYKDQSVVSLYEEIESEIQYEICIALRNILNIAERKIHFKSRKQQKSGGQYQKIDFSNEHFIIKENGYKLWVNLKDYLDTGLFLDHRKSRKFIMEDLAKKARSVLNLFAYTSSFSVAAYTGGSELTTSVDLSNTYCEWSEENFILNNMNLKQHTILKENIMDLYKFMRADKRYDLIIIDPPTFSRSKKMPIPFDIQKDFPYLINESLKKLNRNGVIFFSTNFKKFQFVSEKINSKKFYDITEKTIPDDFEGLTPHKSFLIYKD